MGVWRTVFEAFDRDDSGRVDHEELARGLKNLGKSWSKARVSELLDSYDLDARGGLTYEQFLLLVQGEAPPVDPELVRAFRAMDLDGDGAITAEELGQVFRAAGVNATAEIHAFIEESDLNRDGKVTFEEFLQMSATNP